LATADLGQAMAEINSHLRSVARGGTDIYEDASAVWGVAMSVAEQSHDAWGLWLLWGALTDWVETKPQEKGEALATMVRAAQQWLDLADSPAARETYLEHWLYDEIGYERRSDDRK
jgi:hypothetical protein